MQVVVAGRLAAREETMSLELEVIDTRESRLVQRQLLFPVNDN